MDDRHDGYSTGTYVNYGAAYGTYGESDTLIGPAPFPPVHDTFPHGFPHDCLHDVHPYAAPAYEDYAYEDEAYDGYAYAVCALESHAYDHPIQPYPETPYQPHPDPAYPEAPYPEASYPEAPYAQPSYEDEPAAGPATDPAPGPAGVPAQRRNRRRQPSQRAAKRAAMLTVAVPSVAVMGVAAAAVANVAAEQGSAAKPQAAPESGGPASRLDQQLSGVTRDAADFAERASRAQQRLDLRQRQAADAKRKAEEAARKEALRPKYVLPVAQRGLSAFFGQSGEHWMSFHTGIDFPVGEGTPVMAVTDGTVRTQWNPSYGNMAMITASDGTETWYCHLSSTRIRSGSVQAGTVVAYSGNTGNTTGPHLHFEVRPGGGPPIDPLPWLLSHGLDPR